MKTVFAIISVFFVLAILFACTGESLKDTVAPTETVIETTAQSETIYSEFVPSPEAN